MRFFPPNRRRVPHQKEISLTHSLTHMFPRRALTAALIVALLLSAVAAQKKPWLAAVKAAVIFTTRTAMCIAALTFLERLAARKFTNWISGFSWRVLFVMAWIITACFYASLNDLRAGIV